jgi:polyisoprenoid-binding protein YceI
MLTWRLGLILLTVGFATAGLAQEIRLEFTPAQTRVEYSLDATAHTVHGTFSLRRGSVQFNPATGVVSGELVIDAASGNSGNDARDRKMHRDVLESAQFPDITFTPDRVDGKLAAEGPSTVQVHGSFNIHGAAHEMTLPVVVESRRDRWTASTHFDVPYIDWGMKNPSTFILHVSHKVEIRIEASGGTAP